MLIRCVVGNSMLPALRPGVIVVARKKKFSLGDIVIAKIQNKEVIKRVVEISPNIVLEGDNPNSAKYVDVPENVILGVVIWPKIKNS